MLDLMLLVSLLRELGPGGNAVILQQGEGQVTPLPAGHTIPRKSLAEILS